MADEIEHDYLPVTLEIGALMERYDWFFEQLDVIVRNADFEQKSKLLRVKRDTMNDYANLLLTLKHGRKQRGLDIQILNELHLEGTKTAKELAEKLGVSEKAVKNHYTELRDEGLIMTKKHVGTRLTEKGKESLSGT